MRTSQVLLAVIGPRWLTAAALTGGRALDRHDDWVRREISEAFVCGVTVIPVLVGAADRLTGAPLPADISALSRCQYLRLRHDDAEHDLRRIVEELVTRHGLREVPSKTRHDTARRPAASMKAKAYDNARVYQVNGDQVIYE